MEFIRTTLTRNEGKKKKLNRNRNFRKRRTWACESSARDLLQNGEKVERELIFCAGNDDEKVENKN